MQNLIDRLKALQGEAGKQDELTRIAVDEEFKGIIQQLETLNEEHIHQTDELRGLREEAQEIHLTVTQARRKHNIWQDEITSLGEDVDILLTYLGQQVIDATDDAAALRGILEGIRDMARRAENDDVKLTSHYVRDLLGSVSFRASEGLKEHRSGAALRSDMRQLEAMVDRFEEGVQQTGGWRQSDRTLAARVQHCVDHYIRMAAQAVSESHSFKDDVVSWLRGIAINAQSVSWGSTHHEKDARLRGLIEIVETAITKINDVRFTDRLTTWNAVTDSWMKSDFPTREMRSRILDQEQEIKRLQKELGEVSKSVSLPARDSAGRTYEEALTESDS